MPSKSSTRVRRESREGYTDSGERTGGGSESEISDKQKTLTESESGDGEVEGVQEVLDNSDLGVNEREAIENIETEDMDDELKAQVAQEVASQAESGALTENALNRIEASGDTDETDTDVTFRVNARTETVEAGAPQELNIERGGADEGQVRRAVVRETIHANGQSVKDHERGQELVEQFETDGADSIYSTDESELSAREIATRNATMESESAGRVADKSNEKMREVNESENENPILSGRDDEGREAVNAAELQTGTADALNSENHTVGTNVFAHHDEYAAEVMNHHGASEESQKMASYMHDRKQELGEDSAFEGTEYADVEYEEDEIRSTMMASVASGASVEQKYAPWNDPSEY